jgi:hypothetical protein
MIVEFPSGSIPTPVLDGALFDWTIELVTSIPFSPLFVASE